MLFKIKFSPLKFKANEWNFSVKANFFSKNLPFVSLVELDRFGLVLFNLFLSDLTIQPIKIKQRKRMLFSTNQIEYFYHPKFFDF